MLFRITLASVALAVSANIFAAEKSPIIATVNGSEITQDVFELYGERRIGTKPDAELPDDKRKDLIEELVHRELIYQDAVSLKFDQDAAFVREMQEQVRNIMVRFRVDKLLEANPPSEALLKQIYQEQIVGPTSNEYNARHILVQTEAEAKEIIEELNKGVSFVDVAKSKSSGPSSDDGGDLGWFTLNQMVKPFAEAVEKLKPGNYTTRPVESRFGWHVIKLEDVRKVEPPAFNTVHEQIMQIAQNKIISDYIEKLRQSAKIEIK